MKIGRWTIAAVLTAAVVALLGLAPPGTIGAADEESYVMTSQPEGGETSTLATSTVNVLDETSIEDGEAEPNETWGAAEPDYAATANNDEHGHGCNCASSTGQTELTALLEEATTQSNNNWTSTTLPTSGVMLPTSDDYTANCTGETATCSN